MTNVSSRDIESVGTPLRATTEASRLGRRLVRRFLTEWRAEELIDAAQLVTSELISNVVRHTNSAVAYVELTWNDPNLRIAISDDSTQQPVESWESRRYGGYGLRIVNALADHNGVVPHSTGKTVWCTLSRGDVVVRRHVDLAEVARRCHIEHDRVVDSAVAALASRRRVRDLRAFGADRRGPT